MRNQVYPWLLGKSETNLLQNQPTKQKSRNKQKQQQKISLQFSDRGEGLPQSYTFTKLKRLILSLDCKAWTPNYIAHCMTDVL